MVPSLSVVVLVICITLVGQAVQAWLVLGPALGSTAKKSVWLALGSTAKKSVCTSAALASVSAVVPDYAITSIPNSSSNMAV